MLTINEIFHSIQGESTFAGEPCVFVRLTACDLRCSWCDTPYAFHEGRKMSIDEVLAEVDRYGCPLVEVTGGEPLLQPEVFPLMSRLLDSGKTVLLETGGHRSIEQVPSGVRRIMDVKCPGSSEAEKMDWGNFERLTATDEVKFVIKDRDRLRIRARRPEARSAGRPRGGGALLARARCARGADARRMDPRRPPACPPAAAGPQVHLVTRHARRLTRSPANPLNRMRRRAVVLLSGGLDSYTAAAVAARDGFELYALSIDYGQRHARELDAAARVAAALGVARHIEIALDLTRFGGSALTSDTPVPRDRALDAADIPITYVPARNTIFLSLSLAWAEVLNADTLVIGVNALDYSGYPDCRPEFIEAFERLAAVATKAGVEGHALKVSAPLLHLSKARDHHARHLARPRLRPHPQLLRPHARRIARAATATAAASAPPASPTPACPTPPPVAAPRTPHSPHRTPDSDSDFGLRTPDFALRTPHSFALRTHFARRTSHGLRTSHFALRTSLN